ncbi:heterokaryon incompatibility protein [Seiridium cupressi]
MKDLRLPSKLLDYPGGVAAAAPLNPTPSQWSYARKSFALISRAMQVLLFSLILLVIPYLLLRWVCQRIYLRFFHPQKARLREDSKAEDRKESAHGLLQSRFPRPEIYRDVVGMEDWGELEFASAVSTQEYTESQAWKESAHHLNVPKKRYPGLEKHLDMDQIQDWLQSERARAIRLLQRVDRFGFCSACPQPQAWSFEIFKASDPPRDTNSYIEFANGSLGQDYQVRKLRTNSISWKEWKDSNVPCSTTPLRYVDRDPMSSACIARARNWLHDCVGKHTKCKKGQGVSYPTRLLHIKGNTVFLEDMDGFKGGGGGGFQHYATLSYCWGTERPLETTQDNINSHQEGILILCLPKTISDAVLVAVQLNIAYIWVDALCIIQDSHEDWTAECSRMANYYSNSLLTISALDAGSVHEGFLQERNPGVMAPLHPNAAGNLWIRDPIPSRGEVFRLSALNSRGWALQERLLSRRVLHYARSEMFWECLTCSAREGSIEEHSVIEDWSDLVYSEGADFKRCLWNCGPDHRSLKDGAYTMWYRLIE